MGAIWSKHGQDFGIKYEKWRREFCLHLFGTSHSLSRPSMFLPTFLVFLRRKKNHSLLFPYIEANVTFPYNHAAQVRVYRCGLRWVHIPAFPLSSCVTSGKQTTLPGLSFLCKRRGNYDTPLRDCWKDKWINIFNKFLNWEAHRQCLAHRNKSTKVT